MYKNYKCYSWQSEVYEDELFTNIWTSSCVLSNSGFQLSWNFFCKCCSEYWGTVEELILLQLLSNDIGLSLKSLKYDQDCRSLDLDFLNLCCLFCIDIYIK